jgi:hypothetical protein
MLDAISGCGARGVEVKREAQQRYNAEIQAAMAGKVWLANCNNYYRHANGKVVTQFPYSGSTFTEMLSRVEPDEFDWSPPTARKEATACPASTTRR